MSVTIDQLIAGGAYNPELIAELEQYVLLHQVQHGAYNLDANLALLRLYQFEPRRIKTEILLKVVIKALMVLPAIDFSLCMFLVPEQVQSREPFSTVSALAQYLETARFREFWELLARHREISEAVPGLDDAIQRYAIHVLSMTYQTVPRNVLAEAVNIDGPSLDKYLEQQKDWLLSKGSQGQLIELPASEYRHPSQRRSVRDSIAIEQVAKLFPVLL